MKKTILAALLVTAMLFVAACTQEDVVLPDPADDLDPGLPGDDVLPEEDEEEVVDEEETAEGDVRTFHVVGGPMFEFFIDGERNADMVVNVGDTVRIEFEVEGGMPHDWILDEFGAATEIIEAGDTTTIEFVADEAGEFEYYCSVGQHREQGMTGNFIVQE